MTVGILIPIPREFVLTAAANTLAGAELYVYENLTTTPVTLYSDRACTTPAANPIVSVAGFFPRRYMASAQLLTLTMKNTAGTTIHSDDYVAGSAEAGNEVYSLGLTTAGGTTAYTLTSGLSLGAYVSGMAFVIKMNATNTGASTLNVDGLGAKSLTKNGTTALASGDLVSGQVYHVVYDGTQFQVLRALSGAFQALDATLTALAALSTSAGQYLRATGTDTFTMDDYATVRTNLYSASQVTVLSSGSGTYTTPSGAKYIVVEMVGGGGGGAGSGTTPGAATAGGNSTFSTLTANGGSAGTTSSGSSSAGGSASGGDFNLPGGIGGKAIAQNTAFGGMGGVSYFGGAGPGGCPQASGSDAATNTGSGGGGAGTNATNNTGSGGGAGGFCRKLITSPSASYSYGVGAAGAAGTAGTGGFAGGAGSAGLIIVTAFFL